MKELSIEEKAKAYDNVREKIAIRFGSNVAEEIFSEYEESEDERLRKTTIDFLKEFVDKGYENAVECIDWLEKQGEQKQDVNIQINPSEYINDMGGNGCYLKNTAQNPADKVEPKFKVGDIIRLKDGDGLEWTVEEVLDNGYYTIVCADRDDFIQLDDKWELVDQKPAWSKEDERRIEECAREAEDNNCIILAKHIRQLKSLIPKNTWKPSDEQMKALDSAIHCYAGISPTNNREVYALEIMKEQLKKLRGDKL